MGTVTVAMTDEVGWTHRHGEEVSRSPLAKLFTFDRRAGKVEGVIDARRRMSERFVEFRSGPILLTVEFVRKSTAKAQAINFPRLIIGRRIRDGRQSSLPNRAERFVWQLAGVECIHPCRKFFHIISARRHRADFVDKKVSRAETAAQQERAAFLEPERHNSCRATGGHSCFIV